MELILETFTLLLMVNGKETHEKNLMSWDIFIKSIIAEIIMMLINMVLSLEHHCDFRKIIGRLIL